MRIGRQMDGSPDVPKLRDTTQWLRLSRQPIDVGAKLVHENIRIDGPSADKFCDGYPASELLPSRVWVANVSKVMSARAAEICGHLAGQSQVVRAP